MVVLLQNEELKKLLNDSDNNAAQLGKELDQLNAAIRKQDEDARHQKRKLGDVSLTFVCYVVIECLTSISAFVLCSL